MSIKLVNRLIREGNYSEAEYQTSMLDPVKQLVYQSRIAELTGYFYKAKDLATSSMERAKSSEDKLAAAIALSYAHWRLFEFSEGHQVLQSVTAELEETIFELNPWRGTYYNIEGLLYWKEGELEKAFTSFEEALVIRENIGDQSPISYTLNNLGNTYLKFKDYEQAEKFFSRAREVRQLLQHKPALAASANSFGRLLDAIGNHHEANSFHNDCLKIWKEVGNTQFIAKAYRFLAINNYYLSEDEKVKLFFESSDNLFKEIGNKIDLKTNDELKLKFLK